MQDRRKDILAAGLAILREQAAAGLTQPRIATRTGLRQSHLTYYYPTRADLLAAVARVAIDAQLAAARSLVEGVASAEESAAKFAGAAVRHENTCVLAALQPDCRSEPAVRALFNELLKGLSAEFGTLMEKLEVAPSEARIGLLQCPRAKAALSLALDLLSGEEQ